MRAAVVTTLNTPPRDEEFPEPSAAAGHEVVEVLAAGLHPRVRSQADGSHYTSTQELPLIPGIDGVGRRGDGSLVYFVLPDTTRGSMAQRVAIDTRQALTLPAGSDPVLLAAAMNPAMSSWVAIRQRLQGVAGQRVLVLGATGNAGRMAVQIARHLGACHVSAAGRGSEKLAALDADTAIDLGSAASATDLAAAGGEVDVVLDYLWGRPAADALRAVVPARVDDARPLTWVQIGSAAGLEAALPSAALRATRLSIVGSGQGSVPTRMILEELSAIADHIATGALTVAARAVPLADVAEAWAETDTSDRLVIIP